MYGAFKVSIGRCTLQDWIMNNEDPMQTTRNGPALRIPLAQLSSQIILYDGLILLKFKKKKHTFISTTLISSNSIRRSTDHCLTGSLNEFIELIEFIF